MKIRALLIGAGLAGLGGLALYDYNSPDSRRERELHEVEKLKPDAKVPACVPQGRLARPFIAALGADAQPDSVIANDAARRSLVKHDCIRGASTHTNVDRVAAAGGEDAVAFFAAVLDGCKLDKNEYPAPACGALDGLNARGGEKVVAVFERIAQERKSAKEVWLGATYRLLQLPSWRSAAQLADMLAAEPEWEARELLLEKVREKRDPLAREALTKAYAKEEDEGTKGRIKAALLELDNRGRCVAEDEGRGADGVCRWYCRDTNTRLRYPKQGDCALVRDAETPAAATPVGSAAVAR
jgi:hypothetical protein